MNEEFHCRVMQTMEQLALIADIKESAYRDHLTGLHNRRYFYQYAEKLLKNVEQENVLALLDIDFFKNVNDQFGHEAGDQALKQVSSFLKTKFDDFTIARIGGEEFAVVLHNMDLAKAESRLNTFREQLASHAFSINGEPYSLTMSIGMTQFQKVSLTAAMRIADKALYQAKQQDRNCLVKL